MDLLAEPKEQRGGRGPVFLVVAAVVVIAVAAGAWWLLHRPEAVPAPRPNAAPVQRRTPAARTTPTPSPAPGAAIGTLEVQSDQPGATVTVDGEARGEAPRTLDLGPGRHRVRVEKEGFDAWERDVHVVPGHRALASARLGREALRLRVDADVPGASVFLDRKFLGKTPLETKGVAPGSHRLNVSADGYEMYGENIELERGAREVVVRFKEVRLDERVAVVHKHAVGSCRGTLLATTDGLRYETSNAEDAFSAPFSKLEPLQVDYLKKNLRVKARGGKTYNFTSDGADALLSFQKAVEKARQRL